MRKQSVYAVAVASMIAAGAAMGRHNIAEKSSNNYQTFNRQQLSYVVMEQPGGRSAAGQSWSWKRGHSVLGIGSTEPSGPEPAFLQQSSTLLVRTAPRAYLQGTLSIPLASLRIPPPPPHPVRPPQPAPQPAPPIVNTQPEQPSPVAAPAPPAPPAGGVWATLRQCESGDSYSANTGNGYYGAYQFTLSTWYSLGETGLPSQAPPAAQDAAARLLQSRAGWGQWPACAQQLGL